MRVNNHDIVTSNFSYMCPINPIEKIIELYERLLKTEQEKVALLKEKG